MATIELDSLLVMEQAVKSIELLKEQRKVRKQKYIDSYLITPYYSGFSFKKKWYTKEEAEQMADNRMYFIRDNMTELEDLFRIASLSKGWITLSTVDVKILFGG